MRKVVVESPYRARNPAELERHLSYARAAVRDCALKREAPIASHLLLTQPGILDDNTAAERSLGIACGHAWIGSANAVVVYRDLGITPGMQRGIERATLELVPVEFRTLPGWVADNPPPGFGESAAREQEPALPGLAGIHGNPRAG